MSLNYQAVENILKVASREEAKWIEGGYAEERYSTYQIETGDTDWSDIADPSTVRELAHRKQYRRERNVP